MFARALVVVALLAAPALADDLPQVFPVQIGGGRPFLIPGSWTKTDGTVSGVASQHLTRDDGMTLDFLTVKSTCGALTLSAPAARPAWLSRVFAARVDVVAGGARLCIDQLDLAIVVDVHTAGAKPFAEAQAALVQAIADGVRPAVSVPSTGIAVQLPYYAEPAGDRILGVKVPGQEAPIAIAFVVDAEGACYIEHTLVIGQVHPKPRSEHLTDYFLPIMDSDLGLTVCLDTAAGYVQLIVSPTANLADYADLFDALKLGVWASLGEPNRNTADVPWVLPKSKQTVEAKTSSGTWKVVDGARFDRPDADVLISMAPYGFGTRAQVMLTEGACAPGTMSPDPTVASTLFPPELGTVWMLPPALTNVHWTAWVCLTANGQTAKIEVVNDLALTDPPPADERSSTRIIIGRIADSYGMKIAEIEQIKGSSTGGGTSPTPYVPEHHDSEHHGGGVAHAAAYVGVMTFEHAGDAMDDSRAYGGLVGMTMRGVKGSGLGGAGAMDFELGHGNGEWQGSIRAGAGIGLRSDKVTLAAIGGLSVGSIGPAGAVDAYVEGSLNLANDHGGFVWLGGMHCWSLDEDGLDHNRLEVRVGIAGKKDNVWYLGARGYLYPDQAGVETGRVYLVTFGSGAAANN